LSGLPSYLLFEQQALPSPPQAQALVVLGGFDSLPQQLLTALQQSEPLRQQSGTAAQQAVFSAQHFIAFAQQPSLLSDAQQALSLVQQAFLLLQQSFGFCSPAPGPGNKRPTAKTTAEKILVNMEFSRVIGTVRNRTQ
jgi:hypothetical protein